MLLRIGLISIGRQLSIGRCEKPTIITQQAAADSPRETVGAAGSSDVHRDCAWGGQQRRPGALSGGNAAHLAFQLGLQLGIEFQLAG